jgi:hypothetical protein
MRITQYQTSLEINTEFTQRDSNSDCENKIADEFAQALESVLDGEKPNVDNLSEGQKHIIKAINSQDIEGVDREDTLEEYVTTQK